MKPICDDLWELTDELRQPGGVRFPVRMTVVRLAGRALALISPVPIDDAAAAALAALGEVAHVVAPNRLHTKWFAATCARYPAARGWRAEDLGETSPWPELEVVRVAGAPKIDETLFFHRASGSLICADLVFHVTAPANLRTRLVLRMVGAGGGRLAASRAWRFLIKDRAAAHASLARALAWPIRRVIVAHGAIVEEDAAARLRAAKLERIVGRLALPPG
jgi:hypothetical protein